MLHRIRVVFPLGLILLLFSLPAWGQGLVSDRTVHDFGVVEDGQVVNTEFILTNQGAAPVRIDSVSFNCSCTSYAFVLPGGGTQRAPYTLSAGQAIPLQVTFRTRGYARHAQPVSQVLTIRSSDPRNPVFTVTVRATVIAALPDYVASSTTFINEHTFLIDVRTPEAFAQGHLFGSVNIPLAVLRERWSALPLNGTYVFVDHDGDAASQAISLMRNHGYLRTFFLRGGLVEWWRLLESMYLWWPAGATPRPFTGSPVGTGMYSQAPSLIAGQYSVVVDLSDANVFAGSSIPGSVNLAERDVLSWASDLVRSIAYENKNAIVFWLVDDVGGSAAFRAAQQLDRAGYRVKALQGGREGLSDAQSQQLFWSVPRAD